MENLRNLSKPRRVLLVIACLVVLALVYLFQRVDYLRALAGPGVNENIDFIFNKTIRLLINDVTCMVMIFALFQEPRYTRVAFLFFCAELFIVLPLYLVIKLTWEGTSEISSPLLSPIHRLVVNPMLMIMLILAFYYQRHWAPRNS